MRKSMAVVAVSVSALLLAACGGGSDAKSNTSTTKAPATTTTKAPPIAPLTGLSDPSGKTTTRAALWVKIENTPQARPQAGLDVADVVYEEVVDGGITRFISLFHSDAPPEVGPVRSVRPMDPTVVWPLGGIFVYSGGVAENVAKVKAAPVIAVDENNRDVLFRVSSRPAPHNLYARPEAAWSLGGKPVPVPALFQYRAKGQAAPATAISVDAFNTGLGAGYDADYTWDANKGAWARSMQKVAFKSAAGTQVAPQNVIVQFISYQGGVGNFNAEGVVLGTGEAWVFTAGKLIKGTWSRPTRDAITQYLDVTGAPIALTPGRTWVEFTPVGTNVKVTETPVTTTTMATVAPSTTTIKR